MECSCACVEGAVSGAASDAGGLGGNIKEAAVLELAQVASAGVASSAGAYCQCWSLRKLLVQELAASAGTSCQCGSCDVAIVCCDCRRLLPVHELGSSAEACCHCRSLLQELSFRPVQQLAASPDTCQEENNKANSTLLKSLNP
jgi:hypothetical protein